MASGQFKAIFISDDKTNFTRTWNEKDFPAFIEKHLGAMGLLERHHAPEAVGKLAR